MHLKNINKDTGNGRKQLTHFLLPALALLILLGAMSCMNSIPQELTSHEKLWNDRGINNYDYTLERQCFCPEDWRGPVNIQVRNGTAVSVTIYLAE
jgi:hypothetical protein